MAEVEVRDLPADDNTGDTGEVVVQPCPESGVDDILAEVVKCRTASKFPGGPAGSNPWRSRLIWFVPRKVLNTSAIADVIVGCAPGFFLDDLLWQNKKSPRLVKRGD